jgi:hypothetical protein
VSISRLYRSIRLYDLNSRSQNLCLFAQFMSAGLAGIFVPRQYWKKIVLFVDSIMPHFVSYINYYLPKYHYNHLPFLFFWDRVSLSSPNWPGTWYVPRLVLNLQSSFHSLLSCWDYSQVPYTSLPSWICSDQLVFS